MKDDIKTKIKKVFSYVFIDGLTGMDWGVEVDNTYFWIVPGSIILGIFILKDKIDRILSILLILNTGFFILDILTENVDKWSVITMELMIIIIGPLFFKEHAK